MSTRVIESQKSLLKSFNIDLTTTVQKFSDIVDFIGADMSLYIATGRVYLNADGIDTATDGYIDSLASIDLKITPNLYVRAENTATINVFVWQN